MTYTVAQDSRANAKNAIVVAARVAAAVAIARGQVDGSIGSDEHVAESTELALIQRLAGSDALTIGRERKPEQRARAEGSE